MSFIPLHVYSGNSMLRSGLSVEKCAALAKKNGYEYAAICDYQTLSGFAEYNALCRKYGVKPLFGLDFEVEGNLLSAFIKNEEGYLNAIAIDYAISKGEFDLAFLKKHAEGLLFVLVSEHSFLHETFLTEANEIPSRLASLCKGLGEVYLGIPYIPEEKPFISFLRSFTEKYPYPKVAFPHILYQKKEDAITLEILRAIASAEQLDHKKADGPNYYLTVEEASAFFNEDEITAIDGIVSLTKDFALIKKRGNLLTFPTKEGYDDKKELRERAYEGLKRKKPDYTQAYIDRLEYELSVIEKMGYSSYFLIVADYVAYALSVGISVGPGRGSGAASLVSYCLDIVTPDPIENDLLFERFLNPERQSMPDIDVDFADNRRDEVAAYLQSKYGHERVAHIITFQTLGAKAALLDIGRVFEYKDEDIRKISKTIRDVMGGTLRENYKKNAKFRALVDSDPYYLEIVSLAAKIEGLPRQSGIHPAGMVLNDAPLLKAIPIHEDPTWGLVASFEMNYLEEQGFLKMDILGLRNLTLIDNCLDILHDKGIEEKKARFLPYRDPKAIELIRKGKVMGLFQLESYGMQKAIREVSPTSFEEVVAIIALYRPGPMENIPTFARRKNGREKVTYPCKEVASILSSTYGIIVYQEQIMQILSAMAGFSFGQADVFRRAISKKDASKMVALKDEFIEGAMRKGHSKELAEKVFGLIFRFADYGFNKAHSLSYGVLASQMAYLKAHYPLPFFASILDGTPVNDRKFKALSSEIKQAGYVFLNPDVNASHNSFYPEEKGIRFPLLSIKGINSSFCRELVDERAQNGPYKDIFEFAMRTKRFGLTTNLLVKLIDAGAFDSLNENRESLRLSSDSILSYAEMLSGPSGNAAHLNLNFPKPSLIEIAPNRLNDLLAEKEVLGIALSGSLLYVKEDVIKERKLLTIDAFREKGNGEFAAIINGVKTIITKKNTRMAFINCYDDDSEIELTMFSEAYDNSYSSLKEGNLVYIKAEKDRSREDTYIAREIGLL